MNIPIFAVIKKIVALYLRYVFPFARFILILAIVISIMYSINEQVQKRDSSSGFNIQGKIDTLLFVAKMKTAETVVSIAILLIATEVIKSFLNPIYNLAVTQTTCTILKCAIGYLEISNFVTGYDSYKWIIFLETLEKKTEKFYYPSGYGFRECKGEYPPTAIDYCNIALNFYDDAIENACNEMETLQAIAPVTLAATILGPFLENTEAKDFINIGTYLLVIAIGLALYLFLLKRQHKKIRRIRRKRLEVKQKKEKIESELERNKTKG